MGKALSEAAIQGYEQNGYHFPVRVLSAGQALEYRRKLEAAELALGGPLSGLYKQKTHLLYTWAAELVRHPAILDAVEDLLGPDLLCWSSSFFTKEPNTNDFISWHQDATYWGLSEPAVTTAWVALAPSTPESGCMEVIPGTQHEQVTHRDTFAKNNMLSRGQEIAVQVDEAKAVPIVLQPGEMSLHHVLIFHGSRANRAQDRRIGFAIRYMPARVRQIAGEKDSATLVRGVDRYGHFELEPRPKSDFDPEMVALHKSISDRQAKILYRGTHKTSWS
jgi:ectoine hydroxylase-related dioxygenase (phytanoyl-CoA dioxygenase family)